MIDTVKGMSWTSLRGLIRIDLQTRDITQNIHVRKMERVKEDLYDAKFATAVPRFPFKQM
jgi:branched-chain amino acid transport system substrate-binding protein